MKKYYFLAVCIILVAVVAVIGSLFISSNRNKDNQIVEDLYKIEHAVTQYADRNNRLPASLNEVKLHNLNNPTDNYVFRSLKPTKSDTGRRYEYELCADFTIDTLDGDELEETSYSFDYHNKGRQCFVRDVYISNMIPGALNKDTLPLSDNKGDIFIKN